MESAQRGHFGRDDPPLPPAAHSPSDSQNEDGMDDFGEKGKKRYRPPPDQRRRTYERAEEYQYNERIRSRSPDRTAHSRYRHRSPFRHYDTSNRSQSPSREKSHYHRELASADDRWSSRQYEQRNSTSVPPPTAYDLRGYNYHIHKINAERPRRHQFFNGTNGKVSPAKYGSEQRHDLGLCFTTFLTRYRCEMGLDCPWRHHPLSNVERSWIMDNGQQRGSEFLEYVDRYWATPDVPAPGTNMKDFADN